MEMGKAPLTVHLLPIRQVLDKMPKSVQANPLLVNISGLPGDYDLHIQNSSPAVDAGTTANYGTEDFDGDVRVQGSAVDIGADEINGTVPPADTEAPTTPSDLTGTAVSGNEVELSWSPSTDNVGVSGYEIYSGTNPSSLVLLATVTGTGYVDTTVSPGSDLLLFVTGNGCGWQRISSNVECQRADTDGFDQPGCYKTISMSTARVALRSKSQMVGIMRRIIMSMTTGDSC